MDVDPLSLPEVHEHMIRSPPPIHWPRTPNFKAFDFPNGNEQTLHVEVNVSIFHKKRFCSYSLLTLASQRKIQINGN